MTRDAWPPEVEAVLAIAPEPVLEGLRALERIGDRAVELGGRRPRPEQAQALLLAGIVRAGGTDDDVRFLIVHDLASEDDLTEWRRRYPHAVRRDT